MVFDNINDNWYGFIFFYPAFCLTVFDGSHIRIQVNTWNIAKIFSKNFKYSENRLRISKRCLLANMFGWFPVPLLFIIRLGKAQLHLSFRWRHRLNPSVCNKYVSILRNIASSSQVQNSDKQIIEGVLSSICHTINLDVYFWSLEKRPSVIYNYWYWYSIRNLYLDWHRGRQTDM